ncbi:MAG: pyridoxal phosphate-dependent aminotransferase [Oscillospiraceae bacterium]|nr:pyridoxal phosphate-dependent aminotransferase [Oscillospiraceae bacterium]
MYNFDKLVERKGTECMKWDFVEKIYGSADVIPLWIADMDFEVLPEIREALEKRAAHPTYGYTASAPAYRENIIKWNQERNGLTIEKEEIVPVPGVVTAIAFALNALTKEGDKVLINTPVYNPFASTIKGLNRELVTSSLKCEGHKRVMDLADMEEKMKDGVKMMILCNPHNPIGRVWTKEELSQLVDLCAKYNVYLFSDEIHSDIVYGGHKHCSALTVSEKAKEISIVAMAPSKTFNIAGLKSSMFIIQNPELREKVSASYNAFHVGVDLFAYKATEVAYGYGAKWVDELNEYLYENAKFVTEFCETQLPKVKTFVPEGTYLMWLDFSAYGLSQEDLMNKLKTEAKVGMNSGATYGDEGVGYARLNIGCPKFMLEQAMNQIKAAFEK